MSPLERVWIRCSSSPVRDGFIGIHRDVSERGRALQELRDSQQQVREGRRTERILESITDAFYLLDDGWRFACVNERAVHVLGGLLGRRMTRDDFLAQRVWDLFRPSWRRIPSSTSARRCASGARSRTTTSTRPRERGESATE
jgi:PAS domain-containing protein